MKLKQWWNTHKPSKRRLIQLYAALLFNANLKGFQTGKIYQGPLKNICTPGLNCYSCPGASAACPMGALQNALADSGKTVPYYMLGIILLYGLLFGRWICGFLCPFGLIQDLIYKIRTPKAGKGRVTRVLSYFKYVILVFFAVIFPLVYAGFEFPLPGFCKYVCPAGTLEGAVGLLSNPENEGMLRMLGPLFTWKFLLMVIFLVGAVFIYRFFCRFFCPLGALYGLFNRISFVGVKLDRDACTDCGLCVGTCKMDIRHVGDHECINCGECISVCPTGAIQWKGPKILLPPQVIGGTIPTKGGAPASAGDAPSTPVAATPAALSGADAAADTPATTSEGTPKATPAATPEATAYAKAVKRSHLARLVAAILALALLGGALYYYNVIDAKGSTPNDATTTTAEHGDSTVDGPVDSTVNPPISTGNAVGNLCIDMPLDLYNGGDATTFSVGENRGKVTVINFWGTWCGPCIAELPHFAKVAEDYADTVTVVAVHSEYRGETAAAWIEKNYPDTALLFAQDPPADGNGAYYTALGGVGDYPMTVITDADGLITFVCRGPLTHDELVSEVEKALGN